MYLPTLTASGPDPIKLVCADIMFNNRYGFALASLSDISPNPHLCVICTDC